MRFIFYLDDLPEERCRLLGLDDPKLVSGYITYLHRGMRKDALKHVRVRILAVDANGKIARKDMPLAEFERRWDER